MKKIVSTIVSIVLLSTTMLCSAGFVKNTDVSYYYDELQKTTAKNNYFCSLPTDIQIEIVKQYFPEAWALLNQTTHTEIEITRQINRDNSQEVTLTTRGYNGSTEVCTLNDNIFWSWNYVIVTSYAATRTTTEYHGDIVKWEFVPAQSPVIDSVVLNGMGHQRDTTGFFECKLFDQEWLHFSPYDKTLNIVSCAWFDGQMN